MMGRISGQRLQQWRERFERFQSSGLTVEEFCSSEHVSPNTFYYWKKRVGWRSTRVRSVRRVSEQLGEPVHRVTSAAATPNSAVVQFRLRAAEISVPANCLEVIRYLTHCLQHTTTDRNDVFQEVRVRHSIAAE